MRKKIFLTSLVLATMMALTAYADATFSQFWKQDGAGNWYVEQPGKGKVTNAWLCDDAVASNGKDVWYLLDANGSMVTAGLVQDGTGNFYSLETEHNGYYGMLRYKSGNYGGVNLALEGSHGGAFAAVLNADGVEALKAKYGLTSVANISNSNILYTSSFGTSGTTQTATAQTAASNTDERLRLFREYYGMPGETEDQKYEKMMHVIFDLGRSYGDMNNTPLTYQFLYDFLSKTDWPNMSVHDRVQAAFNAVCCDDNGYGKKGYNNGNYYKLATSAEVNSGEWGIPAYHHGTCKEYSETLKWLLELMEVSSELHQCQIEGKTHVAVRINIGGTTYQLDPTNPESKSAGFDANLRTLDDPVVLSMEW